MTRPFVGCLTVFVMGTGTAAITQKVLGPEEFDRAMKTIGTSVESVNRAIESNAYLDAKTPLALSRRVLASTRPFWEINERPDASRLTTEAVVTLDRLDRLLSANAVDASAVATAVQGCRERVRGVSRDISRGGPSDRIPHQTRISLAPLLGRFAR